MNKKRILSIALCALMTAGLAGCAGNATSSAPAANNGTDSNGASTPAASSGPVSLRMWAHWGSEQRRPTIEKIIAGFNEKYAGDQISAEYVYVPFDEIRTKLVASVAAGNPPDVAINSIEAVNVRAMRKQATDITDYLAEGTKDVFYEQYWQTGLYKDRVYAIPFNTDTRMVYYNKDMFETAGIKVEDIKTWDDMFTISDKLDAALKGQGSYKAAFIPVLGNFSYDAIATSNNALTWDNPMDPDKCTLDNAQNVETLEHMKKWSERNGQVLTQSMLGSNGSGAQDSFISGQVAMWGNTCNYIATLEKYGKTESGEWNINYGTFIYPQGPSAGDSKIRSFGGGFVAEVPFGVKDPAAATKLAEYMCNEGAEIWGVEQKDVMCSIKANESPELAGSIGWDMVVELLPMTQIIRHNPYYSDYTTVKDSAINRIVKDFDPTATDSKAVLTEAKTQIEKKIADEKAILGE